MNEKISGMRNPGADETSSSDFFTRLRNVSFNPDQLQIQTPTAPSETLRSVCRPADETNFAKDFLKYRSKIQVILNKNVAGVQNSPAPRSGRNFQSYGAASSETVPVLKNCEALPLSQRRSANVDYFDSQRRSANADFSDNRNVSAVQPLNSPVSFQTPSFQNSERTFADDLPQADDPREEIQAEKAVAVAESPRKDRPIQFGNNPFARLSDDRKQEKKNERISGNSQRGWLSNILSFGILGLISGVGLLLFSLNSDSGNHQLTALAISLLLSGVSMFASVGLFQVFRFNSNFVETN